MPGTLKGKPQKRAKKKYRGTAAQRAEFKKRYPAAYAYGKKFGWL